MQAEIKPNPTGLFRRKFPRRSFQRGVGVLCDGIYKVGRAVEIGEGGLSLFFQEQLPIDKEIVLTFQIPNGSFVVIRAEVKTCRKDKSKTGFVHGCAFVGLVFERKREIRSYVSARDK